MERLARAHFRVIRINRWSVALVLLVALALLLLPARRLLPAAAGQPVRVREGVTIGDRDFSGKGEQEARAMLAEMSGALQAAPVAAHEQRGATGVSYVVPELNGYVLDVDTTWFRLRTARAGTVVEPATRVQKPPQRLVDFPQAVIRQGNARKAAVALLVNVDWGTKELIEMLPVLKRRGVKATFFVSGRWAAAHENLLRTMAQEGHEIATHGYDLSTGPSALASAGRLKDDIARSVGVIEKATETQVRYYAPHMSEVTPEVLRSAADLRLRTVLYSLDTVDWKDSTSGEMILATMGKAKPGDLILLHPKPNTARVLDQALSRFESAGLRPQTLTEVLSPDPGASNGLHDGAHE